MIFLKTILICYQPLKLFTLVGVANLLFEVSPELLYGASPNCSVWWVVPFLCRSLEGIDLCVKRMIIYFFLKAIICFLISLTFRWTLNHIFTNNHVKI